MGKFNNLRNSTPLSHVAEISQFLENIQPRKKQTYVENAVKYATLSKEIGLKINRSLLHLNIFLWEIWPMCFKVLFLPRDKGVQRCVKVFQKLSTTALECVCVCVCPTKGSAYGGTTPPL